MHARCVLLLFSSRLVLSFAVEGFPMKAICYWNLSSWVYHKQASNHVTVACDGPVASAMVHLNRQH
jgi:hypothetical protein